LKTTFGTIKNEALGIYIGYDGSICMDMSEFGSLDELGSEMLFVGLQPTIWDWDQEILGDSEAPTLASPMAVWVEVLFDHQLICDCLECEESAEGAEFWSIRAGWFGGFFHHQNGLVIGNPPTKIAIFQQENDGK
jgi:hypothetical protein